MGFDHIVVDVETENWSEDVGGWERLDLFGVCCAAVYSYSDDTYSLFGKNSADDLRDRLLAADKITGFNTYKFDYPVIWGMKLKDWLKSDVAKKIIPKTNDILRRVWISLGLDPMQFTANHRGWGLDALATGTLDRKKIGDGKMAVEWAKQGNWDLVATYCLHDVKLTRDLSDFVDKYGFVINGKEQLVRVWAEPDEVV